MLNVFPKLVLLFKEHLSGVEIGKPQLMPWWNFATLQDAMRSMVHRATPPKDTPVEHIEHDLNFQLMVL